MPSKSFRYTSIALSILERILGSNFTVTGLEKVPNQPVMFVANHFTRMETFFVPYLIYKNSGRQIRCLADSALFHGRLGQFLESTGNVSTRDPRRNDIVVGDLLSGRYDWMIYPEGSMLKSKEVKNNEGFMSYSPHHVGPIRTGSAMLALKSQLCRQDICEAFVKEKHDIVKDIEYKFNVVYDKNFGKISTHIVPLTITYYPLRPGKNALQKLAMRFIKTLPSQVMEELEIEGNFLFGAEINLHFGHPIDLAEYAKKTRESVHQIPIIKSETKTNMVLRYLKLRLTNEFMADVYSSIQINFDHIFSAIIHHNNSTEIETNHLKRMIYLSAITIRKTGKYRLHSSLSEENLCRLFSDETHKEFDDVFSLAKNLGFINELGDGKILVKSISKKQYDFHEVRLKNPFHVIFNEFSLLEFAESIVTRFSKIKDTELKQRVFNEIYHHDLDNFESDYQIYFDKNFSKNKSVGLPFFLQNDSSKESEKSGIGVVISHGYKAAPQEVDALAQFVNELGFKVYVTRLKGHGTAPINMKDVTWQDWYDSFQRGYSVLNNVCSKIILIGFSTGGLLSLVAASQKKSDAKLAGVISINAAMKLSDIKARAVPAINFWNELMDKIHIEHGKFEYVDDVPENPHINYSRNYIKGVNELEKLMDVCENSLGKVFADTLIIQASKDPVVNPISGKMIFEKVAAKKKLLQEMDFNNHVIVNSEKKGEVFTIIKNFLLEL